MNSLTETFHITKGQHVYHDVASTEFAKHYALSRKGDNRPGGPKGKDEQHADNFHSTYTHKSIRHGFAGSGTAHYTHNTTGETYEVNRSANGEGFHGTDHHIRKLVKAQESTNMNAQSQIRSVAETYFEMQNPAPAPAPIVRPTWVPESITEEQLADFTKVVIEARTNGVNLVEFNGKKYSISVNEASEGEIQKKNVSDKQNQEDGKQAMKAEAFPDKKDDDKKDEPKKDDDKLENPKDDKDADNIGADQAADEKDDDDDDKSKDNAPAADAAPTPVKTDSHAKKALDGDKFSRESVEPVEEKLSPDATPGDYIKDFTSSTNSRFAGKSKAERRRMALGAYYGARKESFEQRGVSLVNVARDYAEMVGAEVKPGALIEEVLTEAKPAPIVQKEPEVVADVPTKKVIEDAKKNTKVEEDPAKKKPEVKVEKKAEKPAPDASSPALPKADVVERPDKDKPEYEEKDAKVPTAKAKPVADHVGDAVVKNPTGAEGMKQAEVPQTHPSDAQGATKYPDLVGNPPFPSQAKSVIGANEETAPKGEVVAEAKQEDDGYDIVAKHAAELSKKAHEMGPIVRDGKDIAHAHHLAAHIHRAAINILSMRYGAGHQQPHWEAIASHRKAAGGNIPGLREETGTPEEEVSEEVVMSEAKADKADSLSIAAHHANSIKAHRVAAEAHKAAWAAAPLNTDIRAHHKAMLKHHEASVSNLRIRNWKL